jgi:phosphohistidine phosphatase
MKTLFLVRHAKSSWEQAGLRDIERPLNARGLHDAPRMARLVAEAVPHWQEIISSPAVRAYETARYFASEQLIPEEDIIIEPDIYEAWPDQIIRIIRSLSDERQRVALFGHNPTFTALINMCDGAPVDNLPTCGVAVISSAVEHWRDWHPETSKVMGIYYPKQDLKP